MRHVVIGTAGHVDHGKTTLVQALTGVQTDRLPEEQRRGITIELGFAPWRLGPEVTASVIDAPGHRKLVHHMIAGASGIDLVLLVVAADEGVMPQTREHLAACKLLGVERAVVAISKIDRVERDLAELAAEEVLSLLHEEGFDADAVLCSARSGEGIERLTERVRAAVASPTPTRGRRIRLAVDRVFSVKGAGTVVTGTLVEGTLRLGTPLRILGPTRELATSARSLEVHGESREEVRAPTRLAINLAGISLSDVERGDIVTDDPHARPTRMVDVWLRALEPVRRGFEASLFVGTSRSVAKIQPIEGELARLRLATPLVIFGGDRFVLRGARIDGPSGAVMGGGTVLDAAPSRRVRAGKRIEALLALLEGDAATTMAALVRESAPRRLAAAVLPSRFSIAADALARAAAQRTIVALADGWTTEAHLEAIEREALALVEAHHREAPLDPGIPRPTLREKLAARSDEVVAEAAIARLLPKRLVAAGEHLRVPSFRGAEASAEAAKALERGRGLLRTAGLQGVSENQLAEALGDAKKARATLAALVREATAVKTGTLWFDAGSVADLTARVVAHLQGDERLTIQQFKTMTGLGRKQTIPLLEHFDREGITKRDRNGSDRLRGNRCSPG